MYSSLERGEYSEANGETRRALRCRTSPAPFFREEIARSTLVEEVKLVRMSLCVVAVTTQYSEGYMFSPLTCEE